MHSPGLLIVFVAAWLIAPAAAVSSWNVTFEPRQIQIHMDTTAQVLMTITDIDTKLQDFYFRLTSEKEHVAFIDLQIPASQVDPITASWRGNITISGRFLGPSRIFVDLHHGAVVDRHQNALPVVVVRRVRVIDHIFIGSVIVLVSLLYINFGAALDVTVLRSLIVRPVGPMICFVTQFLLMPLLSYGLGLLIFPDSPELQLGLFFTGVSPSGGASNMWSVILGGNINLSVLMTTISNFAAFGMMPLWLFTLGQLIFERAKLAVPFAKIAQIAVGLVVPLAIGLAIQKWSPRLTRWLVRLLKPISASLILFIIVFATVTNLYLFELFSWQIVVAGLGLPWLGYALAWLAARALGQNAADALTIAIETGIQNTGIAIFLLTFSLPQPAADLTTVIPVAVAIMTPLPLIGMYVYKRFADRDGKVGQFVAVQDNNEQHIS